MASITNISLSISHKHSTKTAEPTVKGKINFTGLELCQMKTCPKHKIFKLKCQLWGEDGFFNADDYLWTYPNVFYYPDSSPSSQESFSFTAVVGEGLLDEDWGKDEIYAKVKLYNLNSGQVLTKKSNVVKHHF